MTDEVDTTWVTIKMTHATNHTHINTKGMNWPTHCSSTTVSHTAILGCVPTTGDRIVIPADGGMPPLSGVVSKVYLGTGIGGRHVIVKIVSEDEEK